MSMRFTDRATIGAVKKTQEGYVSAVARAVRSGVQDYAGFELGFADRDRIRVYRPDNEVFSTDSLRTFSHAPVTIGHPAEMVDAENWGELAVGEVGEEILRDGEFIAVSLMLKDKKAVDAYEAGTVGLSAGYTAEIEFVDGQADYDAVMKNIRINHLALVDKARAGFTLAGIAFSRFGIGANSTNTGASWYLRNNTTTGALEFRIGSYTSSGYAGPAVNSDTVPHAVVLNYDRVAGAAKLYVDGDLVMDVSNAALVGASVHPEAQIGLVNNNGDLRYDRYPEVFLARRPLTSGEMAALHAHQARLMAAG